MFVDVSVFKMAGLSADVCVMSLNVQFFIINVVSERELHPSQHVSKRGCEERMIFINLTSSRWRVEEDERERREVEREAVPLEGEKDMSVRVSDPEESVRREYGLEGGRLNEMLLRVRDGPSIVKREEEMPVQLTGMFMSIPDVVISVPVENVTEAVSDA